MSSQSFNVKVK
jgi:aldehyde dehydrogenase (NAD+)